MGVSAGRGGTGPEHPSRDSANSREDTGIWGFSLPLLAPPAWSHHGSSQNMQQKDNRTRMMSPRRRQLQEPAFWEACLRWSCNDCFPSPRTEQGGSLLLWLVSCEREPAPAEPGTRHQFGSAPPWPEQDRALAWELPEAPGLVLTESPSCRARGKLCHALFCPCR